MPGKLIKRRKGFSAAPLTAKDWPYDFSRQGIDVKVHRLSPVGKDALFIGLSAQDCHGTPLTLVCQQAWMKNKKGGVTINNLKIQRAPAYEGPVRFGALLMHRQQAFLDSLPGGQDGKHALSLEASSKKEDEAGGYVWATQGMDFADGKQRGEMRRRFRTFLKGEGISLSDQDMETFAKPCHFAAFDTGRRCVVKTARPFPLTGKQKETGVLDPQTGHHPLSDSEREAGASPRLSVHLGKAFLLGQTWDAVRVSGSGKSEENRYFRTRRQYGDKAAFKTLSKDWRKVVAAAARQQSPAHSVDRGAGR